MATKPEHIAWRRLMQGPREFILLVAALEQSRRCTRTKVDVPGSFNNAHWYYQVGSVTVRVGVDRSSWYVDMYDTDAKLRGEIAAATIMRRLDIVSGDAPIPYEKQAEVLTKHLEVVVDALEQQPGLVDRLYRESVGM